MASKTFSGGLCTAPPLTASKWLFELSVWKEIGILISFCQESTKYLILSIQFSLHVTTQGNNAGLNPLVSGTVGAALAARSSGLNAIALSLDHPPTYVSGEPHDVVIHIHSLTTICAFV